METPSITTERLRLRPVTETDIDFVFKLFSRTETNLYSEDPDIKSLKEAKEMYVRYMEPGSDTHFRVIIELTSTTEPIGTIGFYNYITDYRRAEMGYDLLKEYWGQGYMSEAVQAIIKYGFEELGLVRIEATVDPENIRSIKMLERNGFKHEGTLRKRYYYSGKWRDELFYGLLKE